MNRVITPVLNMRTRHAMLFGKVPSNGNISMHKCASFIYRHTNERSHKFADRAAKGVYVGSSKGMNRVFIPKNWTVVMSKNFAFNEKNFPLRQEKTAYKRNKEEINSQSHHSLVFERVPEQSIATPMVLLVRADYERIRESMRDEPSVMASAESRDERRMYLSRSRWKLLYVVQEQTALW